MVWYNIMSKAYSKLELNYAVINSLNIWKWQLTVGIEFEIGLPTFDLVVVMVKVIGPKTLFCYMYLTFSCFFTHFMSEIFTNNLDNEYKKMLEAWASKQ